MEDVCNLRSLTTLREIAVESYPNQEYEIDQFLLNTLLLLTKGRLCYKIDAFNKKLRAFLIELVIHLFDHITISDVHLDNEPLLYLSSNKNQIKPINPAILLGYCYTGNEWDNTIIDRYMVMPTAGCGSYATIKINNQEYFYIPP